MSKEADILSGLREPTWKVGCEECVKKDKEIEALKTERNTAIRDAVKAYSEIRLKRAEIEKLKDCLMRIQEVVGEEDYEIIQKVLGGEMK
jgi:hypothetical protein